MVINDKTGEEPKVLYTTVLLYHHNRKRNYTELNFFF